MLFRMSRVWILGYVCGYLCPVYAGGPSANYAKEFPVCHLVGTLAIGAVSQEQESPSDYIFRVASRWAGMSSISVLVGGLRSCEFVDKVTQQLTCADVFVAEFAESSSEQIKTDRSRAVWMANGAAVQYEGVGFFWPKTSEASLCTLGDQ